MLSKKNRIARVVLIDSDNDQLYRSQQSKAFAPKTISIFQNNTLVSNWLNQLARRYYTKAAMHKQL